LGYLKQRAHSYPFWAIRVLYIKQKVGGIGLEPTTSRMSTCNL
jgi:hypothetical protein